MRQGQKRNRLHRQRGRRWSSSVRDDHGDAEVGVAAISDNLIVVSSGSAAYVFRSIDDGVTWSQVQKLMASDAASVAISHNVIVVGSPDSGLVYVYRTSNDGATWDQVESLTASDPTSGVQFGISVAISSNITVVGASTDDDAGANSGSAYVYLSLDDGNSWSQVDKLTASDPASGDRFGGSVDISDNLIVVGASNDDDTGSAYVYRSLNKGGNWSQVAKLNARYAAEVDGLFGKSVRISKNHVVVGSPDDDHYDISDAGSVFTFTLIA